MNLTVSLFLAPALLLVAPGFVSAEEKLPKQLEFAITKGTNPGGKGGYTGTVSFSREKTDEAFKVTWKLSDGSTTTGWGVPYPKSGYMAVAYGSEATGVAIYKMKGEGFDARWALAGPKSKIDSYELKRAKEKFHYAYKDGSKGDVSIEPSEVEGVANVVYKMPTGTYGGIGVADGDFIGVGAASGLKDFGVIIYHVEKDLTAKGSWILGGAQALGSEELKILSIDGEKVEAPTEKTAEPPAEEGKMDNKELAKLIKVDIDKCAKVGEAFLAKIKEDDLKGMMAMMDDRAFDDKMTRSAFRAAISKSRQVFGKMEDFKPDRDKVDFNPKTAFQKGLLVRGG